MKNEKILIFGDSYSTFAGFIPEGYEPYYPQQGEGLVADVSQTWWDMLAGETDSEIVLNNSWSGSTICNTGYNGDCSQSSSFIFRLSQLIEKGFFNDNKIDRVLVFGGTNDSWTENACGEMIFSDWHNDDLKLIFPGISFFINKLLEVIPNEKIHIIINCKIREEVINGMIEICKHYNVGYTALSDIDKYEEHPTIKGMTEIKTQILSNL